MVCRERFGLFPGSDEELASMAHEGSMTAVERLLAKYRPLVESKARNFFLLGSDHEDVVQEGMIGLFKAIRDFRGDRSAQFRTFADVCITRQIITAIKTASRQKHCPLNAYLSLHQSSSPESDREAALLDCLPDTRHPDPMESLLRQCEHSRCLNVLRSTLSTLEQRVLDCYLEGKSYREMSLELRCRPKAIDNALQRIKRKIGATLFAG